MRSFAAEPHLDLIEPRGVGRRKMKIDLRVSLAPGVVFNPMRAQVVKDHIEFLARMQCDQPVHEFEKLDPLDWSKNLVRPPADCGEVDDPLLTNSASKVHCSARFSDLA